MMIYDKLYWTKQIIEITNNSRQYINQLTIIKCNGLRARTNNVLMFYNDSERVKTDYENFVYDATKDKSKRKIDWI